MHGSALAPVRPVTVAECPATEIPAAAIGTPATVVSDPADLKLLHWTYSFLRDLGRNLDVRGEERFPEREWSQLYEAVGDRLYP